MPRIGIIGTGWGSRAQAPAFQAAGLEVSIIAGRDPEKTRASADKHGIRHWTTDWREVVDSDEVDLVSIVTPPHEHLEMSVAALEAGKHVLCEKPMAVDAGEASRMVDFARSHQSQIALIDHELRFLPSHLEAGRRISEIGPIRYAEAFYSSPGRLNPERPWNWWSDRNCGGGIWGAVGSHLVDLLLNTMGQIKRVQADLQTFVKKRPLEGELKDVTVDDYALVNLHFENSSTATLSLSAVSGVDEPTTVTIHGENGSLRLQRDQLHQAIEKQWQEVVVGDEQPISGDSAGGYFGKGSLYLGRALASALGGDRTVLGPAATFEDGLEVQRVLDAARRSNDQDGSWEDV